MEHDNSSTSSFSKPKAPAPAPVVEQPKGRRLMQAVQLHAFELDEPLVTGCYPLFIDLCGALCGTLGMIPCCICFPNPYKQVLQGYVGLVTKFGKLYKGVDPGLVKINVLSEKLHPVSVMLTTMEIPSQKCVSRDNVSITVLSVINYQITHPEVATYAVENVRLALSERCHTTLRDVIGARELQNVILRREEIAEAIAEIISETLTLWGVRVESILIKDLLVDASVQKLLSMAAEAKRIGESKIITAKAEVESAKLMRKAADILASKAAMQIRYLDAMQQMAKTANSKVIFTPTQDAFEHMTNKFEGTAVENYEEPGVGSSADMKNIALQEAYH